MTSTFLTSQLHATSKYNAEELLEKLKPCQYMGQFKLIKLQCQMEETVMIGFLLQRSDLINRKDLTVGHLAASKLGSCCGVQFFQF